VETQITEDHPITATELRNQSYITKILGLVAQGTTVTDIAKHFGKSRTWVYQIMQQQGTQDLMKAEGAELKTHLLELLTQLEESPSPQDKRTAAVELGKMQRHIEDKTTPTLSQTTNLNITLDLNKLQTELHQHNETLRNLPPTIRQAYWDTYNKLYPNNPQPQP